MKPIYKYIAIIILLIFVFLFGWCSKPDNQVPISQSTTPLKKEISLLKDEEKKLKAEIVYKNRIVDRWHTEWKEIRWDSLIPCPEKLLIADTVIWQDSSLIYSLTSVIKIDSVLIQKQDSVIRIDSVALKSKDKEIKKLHRKMFFWKVATFGSLALNGWQTIKP